MDINQDIFVELQNKARIEAENNPGSDEMIILESYLEELENNN